MIYDDQTSSAMNYYEELGVSQEATEQEIRKAHRRLVKLMHPDAQPDQSLKMLAETQMRRLNSIVSTLLDDEQRRAYDEQLRDADAAFRPAAVGGLAAIPWWLASVAGAVVLTLLAVWLWADHLGSTFGGKTVKTVVIQPVENPTTAASRPSPSTPAVDPDSSKPVGASYTPQVPASQPPPPMSDQPRTSGGISATIVNDPPPVAPTPLQPKPQQISVEKAKPVVAVASPPPRMRDEKKPAPVLEKPTLKVVASNTSPVPKKAAPSLPQKPVDSKLVAKASHSKLPQAPNGVNSAAFEPKPASEPKKVFSIPAGSLVARVMPPVQAGGPVLPAPPRVSAQPAHDYGSATLPETLPSAVPPRSAAGASAAASGANSMLNPRDPLEGEWVYSPKQPERRRAGFYPPEFIDLKLFGSGDPGNLKGMYSAKYVVTDRPVSPEISFELASISKGSRTFVWQSNNGAKGTLVIDPVDEHTIRVDWHTTSAVRGPALTSGQATLVRRQ
jgi:hypothetical protein